VKVLGLATAVAVLAVTGITFVTGLSAQTTQGMSGSMTDMQAMHQQMAGYAEPTLPGQDAFGAIQEIVKILEANPKTDWSKVNLEALRQHLIDMNDVTLNANADATPIDGGLKIAVTGQGRTRDAIQRMLVAHAHEVDGTHLNGKHPAKAAGVASLAQAAARSDDGCTFQFHGSSSVILLAG